MKTGGERLGLGIITARANDATVYDESFGKFDKVLCDVPCSGLGVIRRKPEIRFKKPEDLQSLPKIQYRIAAASAKYLKEGGVVYSTCTLNKNENEEVARRFARENSYEITFEETIMPYSGSDGFYICKMRKGR